jgi:hypothetical protein
MNWTRLEKISKSFDMSVSHPDLRETRARIKCVLGSSLKHMVTHGIEMNITSLLLNRSFVQNS